MDTKAMGETVVALYSAIIAAPNDEALRGVYFDALEEAGTDPARVELFRTQAELAKVPWPGKELRRREWELLKEHGGKWVRPIAELLGAGIWGHEGSLDGRYSWTWHLGFPDHLTLSLRSWLGERCSGQRHITGGEITEANCPDCHGRGYVGGFGPALVAATPVRRVEFSDCPVFPSSGNSTYYLGNLGAFLPRCWAKIENLPSPQAVRDTASAAAIEIARKWAG